mmetsp:Transcript_21478/g.67402  ORF Transcript_21478/g.67402 Transcript_21478/m.67402 type:complete len:219 (+) Transcript_21478:1035-1691(+)
MLASFVELSVRIDEGSVGCVVSVAGLVMAVGIMGLLDQHTLGEWCRLQWHKWVWPPLPNEILDQMDINWPLAKRPDLRDRLMEGIGHPTISEVERYYCSVSYDALVRYFERVADGLNAQATVLSAYHLLQTMDVMMGRAIPDEEQWKYQPTLYNLHDISLSFEGGRPPFDVLVLKPWSQFVMGDEFRVFQSHHYLAPRIVIKHRQLIRREAPLDRRAG